MLDVPYIANWIYEHPGLDLNLKGIWIADPSLSYDVVQQEIPALRFAQVGLSPFQLPPQCDVQRFSRPTQIFSRLTPPFGVNCRTFPTRVATLTIWTILSPILLLASCRSLLAS